VITAGYTPVVHAHTAQVACTFESLEAKIDPDNGQVIERNPDFVQSGDVAEVVLDPQKPISVEPVEEIPVLGVFSVRDMGQTIGVGMVWGTEQ
jgi:elongation factor 1-alpha